MAMALHGAKILDAFACPTQQAAEQVVRSMTARWERKIGA